MGIRSWKDIRYTLRREVDNDIGAYAVAVLQEDRVSSWTRIPSSILPNPYPGFLRER